MVKRSCRKTDSRARLTDDLYCGTAIEIRISKMLTTIMSSMSVNPRLRLDFPLDWK